MNLHEIESLQRIHVKYQQCGEGRSKITQKFCERRLWMPPLGKIDDQSHRFEVATIHHLFFWKVIENQIFRSLSWVFTKSFGLLPPIAFFCIYFFKELTINHPTKISLNIVYYTYFREIIEQQLDHLIWTCQHFQTRL